MRAPLVSTMGELRDLLAGLCCPVLRELPYPDDQVVEITASSGRVSKHVFFYALAVEIPEREDEA